MSAEEKIELITEIHSAFYDYRESFNSIAGSFLAYLYPAIALDEKCQLWGDNDDDIVIFLFLQNNFDENHKIWEFIECLETDNFYVDAVCYTKWNINWEFELESKCKYNIFNRECYDIDLDIFENKGELLENWLIFELWPNDLFGDDLIFRVDNPQKICDICGRNYDDCECSTENE